MSESVVFKQNRNYLSTLPVGSIIAWHKTLVDAKMPVNDFPPGWVPCDGQTINDVDSILNGEKAPDLNGKTSGKSLFLRGGAGSGNLQDDQLQVHSHPDSGHTHADGGHYHTLGAVDSSTTGANRGFVVNDTGLTVTPEVAANKASAVLQNSSAQIGDPTNSQVANAQPVRAGDETRPANMSVVWMMKIKQIADVPITPAVLADHQSPVGALYIMRNGDVGIGTQQPFSRLHVKGDLTVSGALKGEPNQGLNVGGPLSVNGNAEISGSVVVRGGLQVSGAIRAEPAKGLNLGDILSITPNGNVGIGTMTPITKLAVNGAISGFGITPIGSILAWHKSFTGTVVLPDGWVECNGQILNDAQSPYNGKIIPNLNGEGRFLRGAITSGILQDDAFQGHFHRVENGPGGYYYGGTFFAVTGDNTNIDYRVRNPVSDGVNGTPRTASETRPVNMSIVWIMRVK